MFLLRSMAVGVVLSVAGAAQATVISDLSEKNWGADAGAITYDSTTGLEWLDLTYTLGNSINDTESSPIFGEFRWATEQEIEGLFDHAFPGNGYRTTDLSTTISRMESLMEILGAPAPFSSHSRSANGITRSADQQQPVAMAHLSRSLVWYSVFDRQHPMAIASPPYVLGSSTITTRTSYSSSWLVRNASVPGSATSVPVPEPASIALMGLGLVGLGFSRRRKQKEVTA